MQINHPSIIRVCPEVEIFESLLSLDGQQILELGCGDATLTRLIATQGKDRSILATEVDEIQHEKNLQIDDLPNISFQLAGSEYIPADRNSIDTVFMFKSLHHVPVESMDQALLEVNRVLKPGGKAYISEPIFSGDFNEILRIFHDEERVRNAAFDALKRAVESGLFSLQQEIFFKNPVEFENFNQFADKVIAVTHSEHKLSDEMLTKVKWKYKQTYIKNQGQFLAPIRVDLLSKSAD